MAEKIFYVTKKRLEEIKQEYGDLLAFERKEGLGKDAPKIFESDSLSPEFVSFQEDVGFVRARIDELKNILEHHEIIKNPGKDKQSIVGMGARVFVDVGDQKDEFVIVGTLEANPTLGKISNESPVGRALLGRKIGEEVAINSPVKMTYKIKNIKYEIG